jgi:hypothetical protein
MFMDLSSYPDESTYRFIALLNKKIEIGKLMNALGHMAAGLAGTVCQADMQFLEYRDRDGGIHPGISHFPFIVLAADNSNKIRAARQAALARGIPFTDFTSTMTVGTSQEQVNATAATAEAELEYYGLCLFGKTEVLREFTARFSLFK